MEAPEKIWMNDDWVHQFDDKDFMGEDSVEYTRTDAFIEKAVKGIEHLLSGYIIKNFHFGDSYEIDTLIEDFKNYIKGE